MDARQKNFLALTGLVILLIAAVWAFWPLNKTITQGLDLRGGLSVTLTPVKAADPTAMQRALTIMQTRVNGLGVSEATVQLENQDQAILVQIPGLKSSETSKALALIGEPGQLEFVDVASQDTTVQNLITGAAGTLDTKPLKLTAGTYKPFMTGEVIQSANAAASTDQLKPGFVVNMTFDQTGTAIWSAITKADALTHSLIAIVLDGQVVSAPSVQDQIPNGQTEISGSFSAQDAQNLAAILESGALPVNLQFSQTEVVGPTLGQDSLVQGVTAALIGLAIVALYLAFYYRGFGIVAWLALGSFAVVYLGVLAAMSRAGVYALSLPGIAGIVLSIGLAADTSILIFERFKEEIAMGRTPRTAAKAGTRHAILTSLDADAVTFASAIPLFLFAIGPVKGFALTLMIGIVCDLTIAMLFTRPTVIMLAESVVTKMPGFFGVKGGAENA
jgi:protein-export membrane protein SecD